MVGAFRISCEVTMQILRTNRDTLMSVLEAFVHDPLVEWEDERKKEARRLSLLFRLLLSYWFLANRREAGTVISRSNGRNHQSTRVPQRSFVPWRTSPYYLFKRNFEDYRMLNQNGEAKK